MRRTPRLGAPNSAQAGAADAHDRTGTLIHTSYLPARFRWLARVEQDRFAAAVRWVSVGEYLYYRLFGVWRVSYSVASWSGLLNRRELTWDADWLAQLPVKEEQLSPLGDLNTPCQGLRASGRSAGLRWPKYRGCWPWATARRPISAVAAIRRSASR